LEKSPGERLPEMELWNVVRAKTYGATEVLFLRRALSSSLRRTATITK